MQRPFHGGSARARPCEACVTLPLKGGIFYPLQAGARNPLQALEMILSETGRGKPDAETRRVHQQLSVLYVTGIHDIPGDTPGAQDRSPLSRGRGPIGRTDVTS